MAENTQHLDTQHMQANIEKYTHLLEQESQPSMQTMAAHLALGKLYERAGDTAAAIQEFAIAALFYADQGQLIKAMAVAQMIVQLDPQNEEILDRLGELFSLRQAVSDDQLQDYQESIKNIEALQSTPSESVAPVEEAGEEIPAQTGEAAPDLVAALRQLALFGRLSVSELKGISTNSVLRHYTANEPIISSGNVRRSLFVILQGSVKVFGKDRDQRDILLATLNAGTSFGEFALFGRIDPNLTVHAGQACEILEIPRAIVLKLAKTRPYMTEILKDMYRRRILDTALARVPLFSQLTSEDRRNIIAYFKPLKVGKGTTLIKEGESGDSMYFMVAGEVGVYTSLTGADADDIYEAEAEQLLLATLKNGDFFGEQALVTNEQRSATVIAHTDTTLLQFTKDNLDTVLQEYPLIESALQIETYQKTMHRKLSILNEIIAPKQT